MRRLKLLFIICTGLLLSVSVQAQQTTPQVQISSNNLQRTISGTIVDQETGQPLAAVSVKVKGTKYGTVTDNAGRFSLKVPENQENLVLVISSIGFEPKEMPIAKSSNTQAITVPAIPLEKASNTMGEVVVIGYGKADRKKLIGSVGSYKPDLIGSNPLTVGDLLTNKIAGMQVTTASGVPGAANAITIRGVSTISDGGNAPLIVIDGVPMYGIDNSNNTTSYYTSGTSFFFSSPGAGAQRGYNRTNSFERSPLATLNPDDIESIEVLKDAYATAIYGSRGAAGVILITTKKGKIGKASVDIQYNTSIVQAFARPALMNGSDYATFYNTLLDTLRRNPPTPYWPGTLGYFKTGINTNWLDLIMRTGVGHNINATISGGNDRTKFFLSAAYNKEESYIIRNDLTRAQARMNIEQKFSEKFKIGASAALSVTNNNSLNAGRMYYDAVTKAPNMPVKDSLGNYLWRSSSYTYYGYATPNYTSYGGSNDVNPVGNAYTSINYVKDNRAIGNVFTELKLTKWLNLRSEFGVDWFNSRAYNREIDKIGTQKGAAYETNSQNTKYVINNLLNFNKSFGKHQLLAVIGQSFEKSVENKVSTQGTTFFNDQILSIGAASVRSVGADIQQSWALFSAFGRIDYTYNNRYLLGVTNRVDGSSRFAYNRRYLQFPSIAGGWIISNESFMKNVKAVNELKLRGSVGFAGTDGGGGYFGYQGQYALNGTNTYGSNSLLTASSPANPNLKWQRTRTIDAGIDLRMFNNRLTVNVDYYNKHTKNLLASMPMPGFMGFATQLQNLGEMVNRGIEFTINTINIETKNFKWTTSFNIARNRNELTKLYSVDSLKNALNNSLANGRIWLPGESATAFYLYQWGGVNPANGNPIWIGSDKTTSEIPFDVLYASTLNGTIITNRQRVNRGDALPKFFGGMENRFQLKNFDLGFSLAFSYGNKVFNGVKAALYNYTNLNASNLSPDLLRYWKQAGDITDIPGLVNLSSIAKLSPTSSQVYDYTIQRTSDRFLEDGSFIRLSNITLAYNFPINMLNSLGIRQSRIRIFAEANNVFIITKYSGIDPGGSAYGSSALSSGFDEITMPQPRTYRFGFKVGL